MEVICPKCSTGYDFEDTLIGPKGTVVRCTQCGYMFKIFRGEETETIEGAGWMVRKANGSIYSVDRFSTLQKWIVEGKITRLDELSRTGKTWKRLGEIVELSGLFRIVHAERPEGKTEEAPTSKYKQQVETPEAKKVLEPRASVVPFKEEEWEEMKTAQATLTSMKEPTPGEATGEALAGGGAEPGPAPDEAGGAAGAAAEDDESILKPVYQPRGRRIALPLVILAALGLLGYVGYLYRDALFRWSGALKEPGGGEASAAAEIEKARQLVAGDTEPGLAQAEAIYAAFLKKNAGEVKALVALADIYAARAQRVKDLVDFPFLAAKAPQDVAALTARFLPLALEARHYADQAAGSAPDSFDALRAQADALRLGAQLGAAAAAIDKALDARPSDPRALFVETMINFDESKDAAAAVTSLKRIVRKAPGCVACRYRLALMLAAAGQAQEARAELDALLGQQKDHEPSLALAAVFAEGKAAAAGGQPAPDAATAGDAAPEAAGGGDARLAAAGHDAAEKEKGPAPPPSEGAPEGKGFDFYLSQAGKLQNGGNYAKALEYLKKALELNPVSSEALTEMGYCYVDLGRKGDAINSFRKALQYNSRYGPAMIGLAETYRKQGKSAMALQYYTKYLEVLPSGPQAALAKRNIEEIKALLEQRGGEEGAGDGTEAPQPPDKKEGESGTTGGKAVIKSTGTEVKSSIGQPTGDTPKTGLDPYQ